MRPAVHATVVARHTERGWMGAMLRGPSGVGKSDLALRLIGRGWRLAADDYAHVWAEGDRVLACCPDRIADRLEVRGLGLVSAPRIAVCRLALVVDCDPGVVERMPGVRSASVAGVDVAWLALDPRHGSAPDVVIRALAAFDAGGLLA